MAHNYNVGTRAWQADPTEGWIASEVESKNIQGDQVKLVFRLENGEVRLLPFCCYFSPRRTLTLRPKRRKHWIRLWQHYQLTTMSCYLRS